MYNPPTAINNNPMNNDLLNKTNDNDEDNDDDNNEELGKIFKLLLYYSLI